MLHVLKTRLGTDFRAEAFSGLSEFLKFKLEFLSPAAYDSR